MQFPELTRYFTGVLVPVSALRSRRSCGIGEFADLTLLGDWCSSVGLDLIQILPVNDTGFQSSPYSALSAFALHPVYLRLDDLPELSDSAPSELAEAVTELRSRFEQAPRVQFWSVLAEKLRILRKIFDARADAIGADPALREWMSRNPWVREYAAFRHLKDLFEQRPWTTWSGSEESPNPSSPTSTDALWNNPGARPALTFHSWVQFRLEEQLLEASRRLQELGVMLKGDLPILMDEDSVDVWAHRPFFNMKLRAGAPPDMFSEHGQNWGFPVYDWSALAADDYSWWKQRLRQADKFYNAYRIDHVLGFFRIWSIPAKDESGTMGYFFPANYIGTDDLEQSGFDGARIHWLAEPHVSTESLEAFFKDRTQEIRSLCFSRIGEENLFIFSDSIRGERDINELPLSFEEKETLLTIYRDRALIRTGSDTFAPAWKFRECSRYAQLSEEEKERFEALVTEAGAASEALWEEHGRRLLSFMNSTVPMLTCAEDLGVIPEAVPRVLSALEILGLRIPRWARLWDKEGEPYVPVASYPYYTVCAPSVHDTTTMREWWRDEPSRDRFWSSLGLEGKCPESYDEQTAAVVSRAILRAGSAFCVFPLQDLFALSGKLRPLDPSDERVNVPGTYNNINWTYRMPLRIEELSSYEDWNRAVRALAEERRERNPKQQDPRIA